MNPQKTAFIFPAFVSEYLGNEVEIIRSLSDDFDAFLNITTSKYFSEFSNFSLADKRFTENELYNQVSSYIFGCSVASLLKKKGMIPDMVAGNSMGLYTALQCSESINFEDGLLLVLKAYEFIQHECENRSMGMGAIVGLELNDITEILFQMDGQVSLANTNGPYSLLISGEKSSVGKVLDFAKTEGALFTSPVLVDSPYHTDFLKEAAVRYGRFIDQNITLKDPLFSIVSSVDQHELKTAGQIRDELIKNIYHPINWYASMTNMIAAGVNCFVECGAGNSLSKIARFIDGDFKVYPINKIDKLRSW